MAKEILLYSVLYNASVEAFINQMEEAKDSDVKVRMNTPGGDVLATYGAIAKFQEHSKGKTVQVDGQAKSCGFYMCLAADKVECLNVSEFLVHRAAYPDWLESNPELFTEALKDSLNNTNNNLRALIESKVSSAKFQLITGVSLDQMFSLDSRIDVPITAQQAKQMGIVQSISNITKDKKNEIMALSATYGVAAFANEPIIETNTNNNKMTAQEFKAANPEGYAAIVKEGVTQERNRVAAYMVYNDVDPKAVAEAIEKGEELTPKAMAEFSRKAFSTTQAAAITADGANPISTNEQGGTVTAEAATLAKFNEEVKNNLKKFN